MIINPKLKLKLNLSSNLRASCTEAGGSAANYEKLKRDSAELIIARKDLHVDFHPFCVDSYGALGPGAMEFIRVLRDHAKQYAPYASFGANWSSTEYGEVVRQYVSVALHSAVAGQIRSHSFNVAPAPIYGIE